MRISAINAVDETNPDLVVQIAKSAVLSGSIAGQVSIQTGTTGKRTHPSFERVFLRCLDDHREVGCQDIIDLFYSPLFDFGSAVTIWTSGPHNVSIYRFDWISRGCTAIASCGLHRHFPLHPFELILLAPQTGAAIANELVGWVRYALEKNVAYRAGEWLEYDEGAIPETPFAGFLIVPSVLLPRELPAFRSTANLLLFLPVTSTELERAKETTTMEVAQNLFEDGVRDFRSY